MTDPDIIIERAFQLIQLSRFEDAKKSLAPLLDGAHGGHPFQLLCRCLLELGQDREAREAAQQGLAIEPNNNALLTFLGFAHYREGNQQQALAALNDALAIDPEEAWTLGIKATVEIDLQDFKAADQTADLGLQQDPTNARLLYAKALAAIGLDQPGQAMEHIRRGLEHHPENEDFHLLKAQLLIDRGRAKEAKEDALAALRINPNDEYARSVLLDVLKNKNRVLRFFAGNSFNRYQVEWSFWRVVGMVFLWKAVIFWGGLFFLYMLVTWYGSVLYNSVIRLHRKYRYLLNRTHRRQSNYFLALNVVVAGFIAALSLGFINRWLSDGLAVSILTLFLGISFFEMESLKGQRAVGITAVLFTGLLIWAATSTSAWTIPLLAGFLLLLYGFLFSLNVIRD